MPLPTFEALFMTKQLKTYFTFITSAITALKASEEQAQPADPAYLRLLLELHTEQTRNFQHERLIHLHVTFFFATLLFACIICTTIWPCWQFLLLDIILLILLGFYIKHYFFLENTVQKLYPLTQQLCHLLNAQIPAPDHI